MRLLCLPIANPLLLQGLIFRLCENPFYSLTLVFCKPLRHYISQSSDKDKTFNQHLNGVCNMNFYMNITSITSGKCWHLQNDLSTSYGKWHPVSRIGWHFGKVSISSCKCYHGCQEVNMLHFKLYIQAEICIKPSSIITTALGTGFGWVTWCFFCFFLIGLTDIWNAKIFKHH